jgi:Tfp pilus assembly protein PilZ
MYQREREYPRVCLLSEASIRSGDKNFSGMLANLSLNGMYVRTDERFVLGDDVEVTFLDPTALVKAEVKVNGSVVRNDEHGLALKLQRMDVDSFINLRLIIHRQVVSSVLSISGNV